MTSRRWMALCFALGACCFPVGPFPGYAQLVGASAVGVTFFVGSILFTLGGGVQSVLVWPERRFPGGGWAGGAPPGGGGGWGAPGLPTRRHAVLKSPPLPGEAPGVDNSRQKRARR